MRLKISVITVCYNAAAFIEQAAKSVICQTWPDTEWVVIDGGSTDSTLEILASYRDHINFLSSEADSGIFNAMNKGIRAASGDILFFLNADDILVDETVLADVAAIFAAHPETELVFGDQYWAEANGLNPVDQSGPVTRRRLGRRTIQHQTIFARRELFEGSGLFDESIKIVSDYDWILKTFLIRRCHHQHLARMISVMHTGGLSWTSDFEGERRAVMKRYFSPAEIFFFRTLPLACAPLNDRLRVIRHRLTHILETTRRRLASLRRRLLPTSPPAGPTD